MPRHFFGSTHSQSDTKPKGDKHNCTDDYSQKHIYHFKRILLLRISSALSAIFGSPVNTIARHLLNFRNIIVLMFSDFLGN